MEKKQANMNSVFTISVHYAGVDHDRLVIVFEVLFTHPMA